MQLLTLKVFCDLVELGSFSRAGARNKITQSAVSQQVRALENEFGVTFFERKRKKFSVTPEGRIFEQAAREILALVDGIGPRLRDAQNVVAGVLRISTIYSIGLHDLPAKLDGFRKAHPETTVKVDYRASTRVYEDVREGRADVGLVAYPHSGGGINAIVFDEDELVVICRPAHRLARKKKVALTDLAGENFIQFDPDTPTSKAIDRVLRAKRLKFDQSHQFDDIETVKRAVEVTGGISIVPARTVRKEVEDGRLHVLHVSDASLRRPLGILQKQGKVVSPALREFVRAMGAKSPD